MKKWLAIILSVLFIILSAPGCANANAQAQNNGQDIREIAFNQLSSNDKERLLGTWKDGKMTKIILKEGMGGINDKAYIGKEVYAIEFTTKEISRPNYIGVFLDKDNYKLIGYGIGE